MEHFDLVQRCILLGLASDRIYIYEPTKSYTEPGGFLKLYNHGTPEWTLVEPHLNKVDILPYMKHWVNKGRFSFEVGNRGSNLVPAGFTALNLAQKTELTRVAIPAVLKGTEEVIHNMVTFSDLLSELGVACAPEHLGDGKVYDPDSVSEDPTEWHTTEEYENWVQMKNEQLLIGNMEMTRFLTFAASLDPNNILEGFCGAIVQVPRDSLPCHVDSGDCSTLSHNYTAVFSFLIATPDQDEQSSEQTGDTKSPPPNVPMVYRVSTLGYSRRGCYEFMLRLNKRIELLLSIVDMQSYMLHDGISTTATAKGFIENLKPFAIVGETQLASGEPISRYKTTPVIKPEMYRPSAFVFAMPLNLNIYASTFVHAILALRNAIPTLTRRDIIGIISIIPACNDPYKFFMISHEIATMMESGDVAQCTEYRAKMKRNIGYFMLHKILDRYSTSLFGCLAVTQFPKGSKAWRELQLYESFSRSVWFHFEDMFDDMYRMSEHNGNCFYKDLPTCDSDDIVKELCYFFETENDFTQSVSPFHMEIAFRVGLLLGLMGTGYVKAFSKSFQCGPSHEWLMKELSRHTGRKENKGSLESTIESIRLCCTEVDAHDSVRNARYLLSCHLSGLYSDPTAGNAAAPKMVVFPMQHLYDFEYDVERSGWSRVSYKVDGGDKETLKPHDPFPIPNIDGLSDEYTAYLADRHRREYMAGDSTPSMGYSSTSSARRTPKQKSPFTRSPIPFDDGLQLPTAFSEFLTWPYRLKTPPKPKKKDPK